MTCGWCHFTITWMFSYSMVFWSLWSVFYLSCGNRSNLPPVTPVFTVDSFHQQSSESKTNSEKYSFTTFCQYLIFCIPFTFQISVCWRFMSFDCYCIFFGLSFLPIDGEKGYKGKEEKIISKLETLFTRKKRYLSFQRYSEIVDC